MTFLFVIIFAAGMTLFTKIKCFEMMMVIVGYAAALAILMQNNSTGMNSLIYVNL